MRLFFLDPPRATVVLVGRVNASRDICANVMMDVSGVRSSWFTMLAGRT